MFSSSFSNAEVVAESSHWNCTRADLKVEDISVNYSIYIKCLRVGIFTVVWEQGGTLGMAFEVHGYIKVRVSIKIGIPILKHLPK